MQVHLEIIRSQTYPISLTRNWKVKIYRKKSSLTMVFNCAKCFVLQLFHNLPRKHHPLDIPSSTALMPFTYFENQLGGDIFHYLIFTVPCVSLICLYTHISMKTGFHLSDDLRSPASRAQHHCRTIHSTVMTLHLSKSQQAAYLLASFPQKPEAMHCKLVAYLF